MTGFARFLHYVSIALTLVITLSWVMFAVDEIGDASDEQSKKITDDNVPALTVGAQPVPQPVKEEKRTFRSTVDDAAESLTSPFDGIVAEDANVWARKTVPAILGVLLYGLGLAVISRWILTRV